MGAVVSAHQPWTIEDEEHDTGLPTEVRMVDPTTGGQKGVKAERYDLIPWDAMDVVAQVYAYGSQKYADHNWAKGYPWAWSLGALVRHIALWAMGENNDKESKLPHMGHATFHCLTLLAFALRKRGTDNRWRP